MSAKWTEFSPVKFDEFLLEPQYNFSYQITMDAMHAYSKI